MAADGNLYITDSHTIRRISFDPLAFTTLAGNFTQPNLADGDGGPTGPARFNTPEGIVADGTTCLHDGTGERRFGDDTARPDRVLEFVLIDCATAVPDQVEQEIEDFRLRRGAFARHAQLPPVCIEDTVAKFINL